MGKVYSLRSPTSPAAQPFGEKELQFPLESLCVFCCGQNDETGSFHFKEKSCQAVSPGRAGQTGDAEVFNSLDNPLFQPGLMFINAMHGSIAPRSSAGQGRGLQELRPFLQCHPSAPKTQWVIVVAHWHRPSDWLELMRLFRGGSKARERLAG